MPRIRAVILDFDGLILDTESPVYEAWCQIYRDHDLELPREKWSEGIGTDRAGFDPLAHLKSLVGRPVEEYGLHRRRRLIRDRALESLSPMLGVVNCLNRARERGLGLAVASSSPSEWVRGHLERLRLLHLLDAVVTEDDVSAVKPAPDLYQQALAVLGVGPHESIALEDSPHGVASAVAAGVYCIAVPGPMTADLDFRQADRVLRSLADVPLDDLIQRAEGR
jgi:HAD superfamily hydrolase (TIGR01509 family)